MTTSRPRVALISHIYLEKRYRSKLAFLAPEVDLTLISPDEYPFPYGQYRADFSEERDYEVRVYPCRFPLRIRTSTRWILGSGDLGFRQHPPDIIHVENEASSFSLLQALIYRRRYAPRARVVASVWANQRLSGLKSLGLKPLERLMRPAIDFFIAGNSEGRNILVEDGISPDRVAVLPLVGTDTDFYTPVSEAEKASLRQAIGLRPDDLVLGFVGRFVEDKGLMDLLSALQQLRNEMPGRALKLLCVGDGPLRSVLASQGPNVFVVSPGGNGKVLQYYRMMDALVLPSRTMPHWKEQFGMVLVEAMACGLPLVGSSSGAIPEVVGDAGSVFAEGKVPELAAALRELIVSPAVRNERGRRGFERAEIFNHRAVAERTLAAYRTLF